MENRRNRFCARGGIQLCTALVLVSVGANPLLDRHYARLSSPELDLHVWNDRLTERVLGNECGMEAFGNGSPWIPSRAVGKQKAIWKCVIRRRHRKFRNRGSNRKFRFANLWRRIAITNYRRAGPDSIRRRPKAH